MTNPYSATSVDLSEPAGADDTYEPQIFAINGRIGRLRYLAYSFVTGIVTVFVAGILAAILIPILALNGSKGGMSAGVVVVMLLVYIPSIAATFIMAKRRLNDLNHSGWLSLLMFVPFLNFFFALYLIFAPGTKTSNNYGPRPVKNSVWLVVGIIAPFFLIGVLAAIAIPQYQNYVNKAKAAQALQSHSSEQDKSSD